VEHVWRCSRNACATDINLALSSTSSAENFFASENARPRRLSKFESWGSLQIVCSSNVEAFKQLKLAACAGEIAEIQMKIKNKSLIVHSVS